MVLKNKLIDYWREVHKRYGYVEISTPIMLNRSLWERSGHWDHYKNNMYTTVIDDVDFAVKPMNCPGGMLVYQTEMRSYRDLPCAWVNSVLFTATSFQVRCTASSAFAASLRMMPISS